MLCYLTYNGCKGSHMEVSKNNKVRINLNNFIKVIILAAIGEKKTQNPR